MLPTYIMENYSAFPTVSREADGRGPFSMQLTQQLLIFFSVTADDARRHPLGIVPAFYYWEKGKKTSS